MLSVWSLFESSSWTVAVSFVLQNLVFMDRWLRRPLFVTNPTRWLAYGKDSDNKLVSLGEETNGGRRGKRSRDRKCV